MARKVLFIDRDGTLIVEPPDQQIDSLEKLEFLPGVFSELSRIAKSKQFDFVMVTNQDGLGTASFPDETFWPAHNKLMQALENEGIHFKAIHIDKSFPHEQLATRKPGTAMLGEYFTSEYDLANSYVIGDRLTDVQLAQNMGTKSILLDSSGKVRSDVPSSSAMIVTHWADIAKVVLAPNRNATHSRKTNETNIEIELNLDGTGQYQINTGLGFFDHMLEQLAKHSGIDLLVTVKGDLHIDEHHTIEDTAIALGETFYKALGNKRGIARYGFLLPMDDCLAQVALDFGGRPWLVWHAIFTREKIGDMPTEMFFHFFKSVSDAARCNLNIKAEGENEHHKIESIFKAFAKCIKQAIAMEGTELPTTKGIL